MFYIGVGTIGAGGAIAPPPPPPSTSHSYANVSASLHAFVRISHVIRDTLRLGPRPTKALQITLHHLPKQLHTAVTLLQKQRKVVMVILLLLLSVTCTSIGDVIGGDKPPSNCASIGKTLRVHAYGRNDVLQKELNRIAGDTEVKNPLCTVLSLVNGVGPYVLWNYTVIKRSIVIEASSGGVVIRCDPRKPRDDSRGSYEPFLAVSSSQHLIPYVSIRGGITFTDCKLPVIINNTKIVKIRDVAFE